MLCTSFAQLDESIFMVKLLDSYHLISGFFKAQKRATSSGSSPSLNDAINYSITIIFLLAVNPSASSL